MQFTLTVHPIEFDQMTGATRAALLRVASAVISELSGGGVFIMGMTKAELEALLAQLQTTLTGVAGSVATINTAAAGLSADIASLKAMIETGATGDLGERIQAVLDQATALASSTQAQADALSALDAQTDAGGGEGSGGAGSGEGTGDAGNEGGGSGDPGTEP